MLNLVEKEREIIGVDFDEEKVKIAQNLPSKRDNLSFFSGDAKQYEYQKADVFIISDVLHYFKKEEQLSLLETCIHQLNEQGMILIRDADADKKESHINAKWTEKMSTFFGFNKAKFEEMEFISGIYLTTFFEERNFRVTQYQNSKNTSNTLFVATKLT